MGSFIFEPVGSDAPENVSPGGSVPVDDQLHEYGAVPPVAAKVCE